VLEQHKAWVGRHGLPASEWWFADYVQLRAGIWFPKRHVFRSYSTVKPDGTYGGPAFVDRIYDMVATDVRLDEAIPDEVFTLESLHVPEGTEVGDITHSPPLHYSYKAKFTPEEWQGILDVAEKRQKRIDAAVVAQQQARAAKEAAERAKRNQQGPGVGP
jgi:hypothetical protein